MKKAVREQYEKAAASKGFEANDNYTGDKLISERDGIALLDEGVLIYFHPYKIGIGAEGQYNLIIPVRDEK